MHGYGGFPYGAPPRPPYMMYGMGMPPPHVAQSMGMGGMMGMGGYGYYGMGMPPQTAQGWPAAAAAAPAVAPPAYAPTRARAARRFLSAAWTCAACQSMSFLQRCRWRVR